MTNRKTCIVCGPVRKASFLILFLGVVGIAMWYVLPVADGEEGMNTQNNAEEVSLPEPEHESTVSIEQSFAERRSVRDFTDEAISLEDLGQLLWAAQGITSVEGKRTAPSAGATYPLELYVVVERVKGLEAGIYQFVPQEHKLVKIAAGRFAQNLKRSALDQGFIAEAPVNVIVAAEFERTTNRYGDRGERYVHMEAGHAAQNIYLQCQSLELDGVVIGAFSDQEVKEVVQLPEAEEPLYIMPLGKAE